jgi:toxin ParE1/3/4
VKVRWTKAAEADLNIIHDFIASRNPRAAEEVRHKIVSASRRLLEFPEIGRATQKPRFRLLPITGLPYLLVYRVSTEYIEVGSVIDGRMDRAPDLF